MLQISKIFLAGINLEFALSDTMCYDVTPLKLTDVKKFLQCGVRIIWIYTVFLIFVSLPIYSSSHKLQNH